MTAPLEELYWGLLGLLLLALASCSLRPSRRLPPARVTSGVNAFDEVTRVSAALVDLGRHQEALAVRVELLDAVRNGVDAAGFEAVTESARAAERLWA